MNDLDLLPRERSKEKVRLGPFVVRMAALQEPNQCTACLVSFESLSKQVLMLTSIRCGHRMCSSCIQQKFHGSGSIKCPKCGEGLVETDFSEKTANDEKMERAIKLRKTIKKQFNKLEANFETLREYNDYCPGPPGAFTRPWHCP